MYKIDLANLVKNKLYICKEYHIQPSEIDRMYFYDYETMMFEIKNIQIEQEKENEKQQKQYDDMHKNMNASSMMSQAMNSVKMPSISMPSFSMPKLG